jgi:hypothetical protein
MSNPPSFAMRVSIDRSACHDACLAGRALAQLQRDGVPGVDVRWVGADEPADATLQASDVGVRLLLPGAADRADSEGPGPSPSTDDAQRLDGLARDTASALHRVARARNLLQLAARVAPRAPGTDIRFALTLRRRGTTVDEPLSADRLTITSPGDLLVLDGRNAGGDPVDTAAFWLGSDQSIQQVYPRDARESPRIAGGDRMTRIGLGVDSRSTGTERLLIVTVPMRPGREVSDFRFLEQAPLSRLRGAADPDLQALFDACFADYRMRGSSAAALPAERLGMQAFTFEVRP